MGDRANDPRWMLVRRIVASPHFKRSALLANFLLFVCDRSLAGQSSEITEKQIGFHVFGRMEGYNASDDNIVRNYARTLRRRLEEYFAAEGKHEAITLFIPRGGYVPVFSSRESEGESSERAASCLTSVTADEPKLPGPIMAEESAAFSESFVTESAVSGELSEKISEEGASHQEVSETASERRSKWVAGWNLKPLYLVVAICTIVLSALAGYVGAHLHFGSWGSHETSAVRINRVFWSQMFDDKRDTFVVPADGGLVMLQSFIRNHVSLEAYANGRYLKESEIADGVIGLTKNTKGDDLLRLEHKVEAIGARRYTSIVDLELTTSLARLPEVVPERLMIRYARDLRIDDLRTGNAILMGSGDANPWVDLFQRQLNFRFSRGADFGGSGVITNQHPLPGEHASYASEPDDPLLRTYGVIAYVPNLEGAGHALLIEGVNMAGTQAAGEFLLAPEQMESVLNRAKLPNGAIRPFEVLIETDNIAANASRPHVIAWRIGS
jgi:hypothetical protein